MTRFHLFLFYCSKCCFTEFLLSQKGGSRYKIRWIHKVRPHAARGGKADAAPCPQATMRLSMISSHFLFLFKVTVFPKDAYTLAGRVVNIRLDLNTDIMSVAFKQGNHKSNVKTLERKARIWQQITMCQLVAPINTIGIFLYLS